MKFTFLLLDILSKVCRVHLRIVGRAWFSLKQGHSSKILFARLLCRWLISYHENNEFVLFRLFNSSNIQTIILTYQARLACRKITFPCLIFHVSSHIWKSDSAYVIQFALAKMSEPEIEPYIWKFWGQFFESSSEFFTYSVQIWICLPNSHNHTKFSFWVIRKFLIFFPYVTIFWHKVANFSLLIQEIPFGIIWIQIASDLQMK